jgi:putative sigma-54 modulation protein
MKIHVRSLAVPLTDDLAALIERRVRYGLTRFAASVQDVHVTLDDVNGPRGGLDKVCRIRVHTGRRRRCIVDQRASSIEAAVSSAAARAARAVARELAHAHELRP